MIILERLTPHCAVLDIDGTEHKVDITLVKDCCEGDVLIPIANGYAADKNATELRRNEIIKLQNSLFE